MTLYFPCNVNFAFKNIIIKVNLDLLRTGFYVLK